MLTTTHALFSGLTGLLAFGDDPAIAGLCAIAGILPDIDTPRSVIGRSLYPISKIINHRFGHRQVTHSVIGSIAISLLTLPVLILGVKWYGAIVLGYSCGWLLDACSKSGIPVMWPSPKRLVFPFNPEFRLTTGSPTERLLQAVLILMIAALVASAGAKPTDGLRSLLASEAGAIEIYREQAATRQLWAEVEGVSTVENRSISGRFEVIGADGDHLIISSGGKRYALGEQITAKRVAITPGKTRPQVIQPVAIVQPTPVQELIALMGTGDRAYGQLTHDEPHPEETAPAPDPTQHPAVAIAGSTMTVTAATITDLEPYADWWIVGNATVYRLSRDRPDPMPTQPNPAAATPRTD